MMKNVDRIAIAGENGCGKSTLLKLMAGKIAPVQGEHTITTPDGSTLFFSR
ncbi:ATP-binding cassette domain-containing protein [Photorhabdus tasmaniensis]|uniref:ABC transporter domain-containing protein n=1 Tax=Photorhabdus tasmaniensis TaxID=1004159 RepID=A0ABX0GH69_9GAMM|nr:ATP-binding cassette domain-containing protein [Photorhabdus tasmaniensis]NHB87780.1 hypothetical protein [Photorhabdus tasmaniensis]